MPSCCLMPHDRKCSQGEDDDTDEENGGDNDDKVCINDDDHKTMPMETILVQINNDDRQKYINQGKAKGWGLELMHH